MGVLMMLLISCQPACIIDLGLISFHSVLLDSGADDVLVDPVFHDVSDSAECSFCLSQLDRWLSACLQCTLVLKQTLFRFCTKYLVCLVACGVLTVTVKIRQVIDQKRPRPCTPTHSVQS